MTTGGFDPNQNQQYGQPQQQYGQPQQQYGQPQQQFGQQAPQQFGAGPGAPGELLPRLGARVIDGLIVGIPTAIVNFVIVMALGTIVGGAIGAIISAGVALGYFVFLETTKGQTFGKQILKLRVVGPTGGLPTQKESLTRNAFYGLALLGIVPFIGTPLYALAMLGVAILIAVTINQNPQRLGKHDELAGGTRVIQE